MQLQIDVNSVKSTIFLEVLNDLFMIGDSLRDAKNGLGHRTSTIITMQVDELVTKQIGDD